MTPLLYNIVIRCEVLNSTLKCCLLPYRPWLDMYPISLRQSMIAWIWCDDPIFSSLQILVRSLRVCVVLFLNLVKIAVSVIALPLSAVNFLFITYSSFLRMNAKINHKIISAIRSAKTILTTNAAIIIE